MDTAENPRRIHPPLFEVIQILEFGNSLAACCGIAGIVGSAYLVQRILDKRARLVLGAVNCRRCRLSTELRPDGLRSGVPLEAVSIVGANQLLELRKLCRTWSLHMQGKRLRAMQGAFEIPKSRMATSKSRVVESDEHPSPRDRG